ncbi:MAG: 3-carboxy-cis,cis-muconate cycloisomerase, partial [Alphaproteobacteria bacterium]|nr:3-carboxy-cis,cis-muconate cycloisomerase [Alphaproteobacteria bacterium]
CAGSYRASAGNPERPFVEALHCKPMGHLAGHRRRHWGLAAVEWAAKAVGRRIAMTSPLAQSSLLTPLISSAAMRAILDDRARLQRMLDFETALARAEAQVGIVPALAVERIAEAARADRYDLAALGAAAAAAGNIAIPLINALTAEVAKTDAAAAGYVHWGATSQDVIDSALVLELRAAIDALIADLDRAIAGFTTLAARHRRTATVARTWMQHAVPMPFGLKLAGYAAALARSRERLQRLRREALVLQFGGAAGTLAALGDRGLEVAERLAALLDLPLPDAPWHSHRDRLAEVASAFAILTGTCGKIARDVSLLMQTEVAEAFEPAAPGRGGSSTMPHKRNPTAAATALAAATIAPNLLAIICAAQVQEHERALGGWQAEWPAFPALALVTSGALDAIVDIAEGLDVDEARMRVNLAETRGRIMAEAVSFALASKLGKHEAHGIVEEASRKAAATKRDLQDVMAEDDRVKRQLTVGELAKLFEPMAYQGAAQTFIDRLIGSLQARGGKR